MHLSFDESSKLDDKHMAKLEKVLSKGTTVLLNHAHWCGHCRMFAPSWQAFKDKMKKNKVNTIDIEYSALEKLKDNKKLFRKITKGNELYFPMIIFFVQKGDKNIKKVYDGNRSTEDLEESLKQFQSKHKPPKGEKAQKPKVKKAQFYKGGATKNNKDIERQVNDILDKFFKL